MANGTPPKNLPIPANGNGTVCQLCGDEPICQGLGVIRYQVPIDDPRFGKLFRCPNHRLDLDTERQEKLRKLSNLGAFGDKTFRNFEVYPQLATKERESLTHAVRVAEEFADNPYGWMVMEGTYGCGKTHLAAAVGNIRLQHGDMVLFITTADLLDHLRSTYSTTSEVSYDEMFERVRNSPFLILDDLGVENPSAWAQEKLFQLLNHRYNYQLPTVITTNVSLDRLDDRIRSRLLDTNLIRRVLISAPDYRSSVKNQYDSVLSNLELYKDMTFETFDISDRVEPAERESLRSAFSYARQYAKRPEGWLVFTGRFGAGKTHLAAAIVHYILNERPQEGLVFTTVPDLLDHLRVTFSPDSNVSFDQRFFAIRNAAFLVLDDFSTDSASSWAKEKLFQILDYRYLAQLPTVITTHQKEVDLDPRIRSRLLDERRCLIVNIESASYVLRIKRSR